MSSLLVWFVLLAIPLGLLTAFIVCLIRFLVGKGHGIAEALLRPRKIAMIITGAMTGAVFTALVAIIAMVYYILTHISM